MSEPSNRLINLVGALALGVTDRMRTALASRMALGGEAGAALIVIGHTPGLSVDQLSRVLRLSHPGTVRLVDRLVSADLVMRRVAENDRRQLALGLTEAGGVQRKALLEQRNEALKAALGGLAPKDRAALERIAADVLHTLPVDAVSAMTICRYCNEQRCENCPMDSFGVIAAHPK